MEELMSDFDELSTVLESEVASNSCSPYDSASYAVVAAVSAGLAFLSMLCILPIIAITVLFKKWKFFSQRLVLYLALSALLVNAGIILHRVDYRNQTSEFYHRFCEFGGYLDQVSNWMLLLAISSITLYCSLLLYFNKKTDKYELVYVFFIFVFPFLFTWVPFIGDSYGRAGAWCWIRSEDAECNTFKLGQWFQFTIWFVPLYTFMFVLIVLYTMILIKLYCNRPTNKNDYANMIKIKGELIPLIAYPLIYFLLNILPFINRTYNSIHNDPSLALWYLAALANPTMGAWLALAFTLAPGTRKRLTIPELTAATKELCRKSDVVMEYPVESGVDSPTESLRSTDSHPYRSYEDCYRLNLSISSTSKTATLQ